MRPERGCPENFRDSLTTPTATIPKIFHGLLFRLTQYGDKTVQIPMVGLNIELIVSFPHNTFQAGEGAGDDRGVSSEGAPSARRAPNGVKTALDVMHWGRAALSCSQRY